MPTIQQYRTDRLNEQSRWLLKSACNLTSQFGEDGVIVSIFKLIGMLPDGPWCVEFGAADGESTSNTYNLIWKHNWKGVLIEGSPEWFAKLQKNCEGRNHIYPLNCIVEMQGENSLDNILKRTPIPKVFDFLSIDIDGNDYYVWDSLREFRPRIVVVEFNPTVANDVLFVQDPDPNVYQGCSLRALIELGKTKGYELICATLHNGFFVVKEEYHRFHIEDNSIDAMYAPAMDGKIFHCFDGTIYTAGMDRLIWQGIPVAPDALQLLPKDRRKWGASVSSPK